MTNLFISKNSDDLSLLPLYCANNNIGLNAQSLIDFKEIPFHRVDSYDVLFVNSIRAFAFFTQSIPLSTTCEIACIGSATADRLRQLGYTTAFVGSQAGNPTLVAKEVKKWVGDRNVLIPCSSRSARTVAKELNPAQVTELIVYETVLLPKTIETADVYIFTSPSNVNSFFIKNNTGDSLVIAWGKTTEQALNLLGVKNILTMTCSTEEQAIKMIENRI